MHKKCAFGLVMVLLASGMLLLGQKDTGYRSKAIIAILPGNPFDSRLYSLQRNVLTQPFISRLMREHSINTAAMAGPVVRFRPESSFEVMFEDSDAQKAVAVVAATMEALVQEMERRRAADPSYGSVRTQSPARWVTGEGRPRAEGVLVMGGFRWGQAEKREANAQATALIDALCDMETLRTVARQGASKTSGGEDAESVAKRIRSSMSFRRQNDSWIEVTLTAPDATFLERLLEFVPKGRAEFAGKVPLADIDFVPKHMRDGWYIFNCCQMSPL